VGGQVLEEIQLRVVGPVDVLEDEQGGSLERDLFDEPPSREEQLDGLLGSLLARPESDERPQERSDVVGLVRPHQLAESQAQLPRRLLRGVRLEDPRHRVYLFGEGAVARLAVRQASSPDRAATRGLDPSCDLRRDPRLADAGRSDDRDQVGPELGHGALPDGFQEAQLAAAADERRRRRRPFGRRADRRDREPRLDRVALALGLDGLELAVADHVSRRPVRLLADHQPACRRRGLQPRGGVHDVAQRERHARLRSGSDGDHGLARVDGRAHRDRVVGSLAAQPLDRVDDAESRADRALSVVAVRHRRAEDGHDGVADELLDGALETLDLPLGARVELLERVADVLGIGSIRPGREPDHVDEQHRDELPLFAGSLGGIERRRRRSGRTPPRPASRIRNSGMPPCGHPRSGGTRPLGGSGGCTAVGRHDRHRTQELVGHRQKTE
jgi:hypothetical protein